LIKDGRFAAAPLAIKHDQGSLMAAVQEPRDETEFIHAAEKHFFVANGIAGDVGIGINRLKWTLRHATPSYWRLPSNDAVLHAHFRRAKKSVRIQEKYNRPDTFVQGRFGEGVEAGRLEPIREPAPSHPGTTVRVSG
jgi:hypothetical protein